MTSPLPPPAGAATKQVDQRAGVYDGPALPDVPGEDSA